MQRLISLRSKNAIISNSISLETTLAGTARLSRVAVFQPSEGSSAVGGRVNFLPIQRYLSNKSSTDKGDHGVDAHAKLYKPSTEKEETHVPDALKGGQDPGTFATATKTTPTLTGGGKVW